MEWHESEKKYERKKGTKTHRKIKENIKSKSKQLRNRINEM